MDKFQLQRAGLIALIILNVLTGILLMTGLMVVLTPQILAKQEAAGVVNAGTENTAFTLILSLLVIGCTAFSVYIPYSTLQHIKAEKDATALTWASGILNILSFPLGTVAAILTMLPLFDPISAQRLKGKVN